MLRMHGTYGASCFIYNTGTHVVAVDLQVVFSSIL